MCDNLPDLIIVLDTNCIVKFADITKELDLKCIEKKLDDDRTLNDFSHFVFVIPSVVHSELEDFKKRHVKSNDKKKRKDRAGHNATVFLNKIDELSSKRSGKSVKFGKSFCLDGKKKLLLCCDIPYCDEFILHFQGEQDNITNDDTILNVAICLQCQRYPVILYTFDKDLKEKAERNHQLDVRNPPPPQRKKPRQHKYYNDCHNRKTFNKHWKKFPRAFCSGEIFILNIFYSWYCLNFFLAFSLLGSNSRIVK